jgi:hypothetical protein
MPTKKSSLQVTGFFFCKVVDFQDKEKAGRNPYRMLILTNTIW